MNGVLDLANSTDVSLVGGKAGSLAKLLGAGFNVPAGFVITINSNASDEEILERFGQLNTEKVAVRSSAAAEDGVRDAWAGQFDTFLNVDRNGLIEAIKECQASADSERAKAYAKEKNLRSGKVAAIVQKMVPAEVSGVAFSAHPVTGDKNQLVIEAVEGLAEGLVSGQITPDNYIVDRDNFDIIEFHLSSQNPLLDNPRLSELTEQIIKIERLYGFPVDVEWSIADSQIYILQARPITTL